MSPTAQNYYKAASIALKELKYWPEYLRKEANAAPPSNKPLRALYAYIDLTNIAADEKAPKVLKEELNTLMPDTVQASASSQGGYSSRTRRKKK